MRKVLSCFLTLLSLTGLQTVCGQETFPINGPKPTKKTIYALINVNIIAEPGKSIPQGTILVQENKIIDAGANLKIPDNAIIKDLKGLYVYPGLIDFYSSYGITVEKNKDPGKRQGKTGVGNWNEAIKPEINAVNLFKPNSKEAEELRNMGFSAVVSHQKDGIMRGISVLVGLGEGSENNQIIKERVSQHLSFDKGSSKQDYPSSLMGVIALIRQTYLDANWYPTQTKEFNSSLAALNNNKTLPSVFECNSVFNIIRAQKIGSEFGISYIFKSGGDDYKRIEEIKNPNTKLILPLNFPKTPEINDINQLREVSLSDLKHWELAPYNPAIVYESKIPFVFTASDLKDKSTFWNNLRKAIKNGLPADEALKALTTIPAQWAGVDKLLGQIKKDYLANLLICTKPLFDEENIIVEIWTLGERFEINPIPDTTLSGVYQVIIGNENYTAELKGNVNLKGTIKIDTLKYDINLNLKNSTAEFTFNLKDKITYFGTGWKSKETPLTIKGSAQQINGQSIPVEIIYQNPLPKKDKEKKEKPKQDERPTINYPLGAYGFKALPKAENVLIKNATVWTNTTQGIKKLDVLIENGKIADVGVNLNNTKNYKVIDAGGKHLTNGIIDEHSHIAIVGGVNEGTQENTAEVRIEDALNSEDINIYRQLAGGVTAAQLLHGSANPIGGQSALIKMRWGQSQEKLKIQGADGFIKFALGENVKQSNWGAGNRYPKTRMGVEQVYMDAFYKAHEYQKNLSANPKTVRRNLELETVSEILNKKRFITCHSYIQSEINMLMHVADSFKFKVNTFTHILEGYKVADKMKKHGVYASTFADWWAYKFEVNDAIPYNAALLTNVGVCTAINSDNAEMARRLNQEAAKTVKYGGLTEEEAWKTVTLNPAKMLHLDNKMGSIEKGKDADLVIWSDNPLSIYAKVEKTFVDGICLFDQEQNQVLYNEMQKEKLRLFAKISESRKNGDKTESIKPRNPELYHCDTEGALE